MKKLSSLMSVLLLCISISPVFGEDMDQQKVKEVCQMPSIMYEENKGGGDTAGASYNNVFARFVESQEGDPSFWFYVYKKGKIWLCDGVKEEDYKDLPEYIAVRVYKGNQEQNIQAQYRTYETGAFIVTNSGAVKPLYFTANGQNHLIISYVQPDTIVLSAALSPYGMNNFSVPSFHKYEACGEEKPEFAEMLKSFTLQ